MVVHSQLLPTLDALGTGMKRWVVIPGAVVSQEDGETHFIGAQQLMNLYGVPRKECVVVGDTDFIPPAHRHLPKLRPRYDGDYSLPIERESTMLKWLIRDTL